MKSKSRSFRLIRRAAIGVGTFLFGWGWVGVVPVDLPFDLPAVTLPRFDWMTSAPVALGGGSAMAVPEPGPWLLMIGGMLLMGAALRSHPRRRLQPAF